MLKWLITLGLLAIVAWRWWTNYRKFLARIRQNKAASTATLGAQRQAKPNAKTMVLKCHRCGTLMPPELGIQQGSYFFCKEHVPANAPDQ